FALILALLAASLTIAAAPNRPLRSAASAGLIVDPLAAVAWPVSTLVVSEVQTGGASASDEFAELYNGGSLAVDLAGLEVVYATSTGSTVTRKATWTTTTILEPGRHLLIANAAGIHAAMADATYSGGFAATGGAVALRVVGANAIDAVGWGDATNAFVEGIAAPAPPARSSLERGPGGPDGNGVDTNDNVADWFVQVAPSPQGSGSGAVPAPVTSASPTVVPTPPATATPGPVATVTPAPPASAIPTSTVVPTPTASPTASAVPTATASPIPTASPSPTATATPTPARTQTPSPTPTATATPTPSPTQTPAPRPIADARGFADDTTVAIAGVLTTALGALESGRGGFIQDASGGIALYLDAAVTGSWPAGSSVVVEGVLGSRYSQRTLRISETSVTSGGPGAIPPAVDVQSGLAGEAFEGLRVKVTGSVVAAPDQLADGLGVTIDDGSGPIRAVIGPAALAGRSVEPGMTATVSGPLGQRDSSGTGAGGYRIQATLADEAALSAATPTATPMPTATPTPTPTPAATATGTSTATPTAGPTASSTPTPRPTSTPSPTPPPTASPTPTAAPSGQAVTLDVVRSRPPGVWVSTSGVVIAEAGRLGSPELLAIADATGGIAVRLPAMAESYGRGMRLEVSGRLAAPYGQLEIRPAKGEIRILTAGTLPVPITVPATGLTEALEGRLATLTGHLAATPRTTSGGDVTIVLERDGGATAVKVSADASSRITARSFKLGATYRVVGFVGQRAARSGALDGYRLWLRDTSDITLVAASSSPGPSPTLAPGAPGATAIPTVPIARALRITDRAVAIDAVVTTPATLLDATRRRIVVQDPSGAVELLLPTSGVAPTVGARVHVEGRIGVAYGAPRLRVDRLDVSGRGLLPSPIVLHALPGAPHEWRLVRVAGQVTSVHKLGDRWRAELLVGTQHVVIVGQPGAGIPSTTLVEGRTASVIGIARRPSPGASDHRFVITPRFPADVQLSGPNGTGSTSIPSGGSTAGQRVVPTVSPTAGAPDPAVGATDADLGDLATRIGTLVRVGGIVTEIQSDGFSLDDGTATGRVVL
ncbi:MAG: uncharacterized protein QOG32_1577, partial [Chloroflexota bacterium]|nr:uncharacterized protein [Chloroflexota bacterium]